MRRSLKPIKPCQSQPLPVLRRVVLMGVSTIATFSLSRAIAQPVPSATPAPTPGTSGVPLPAAIPLPSQQQPPVATLQPVNGVVSVRFVNKTGADIVYQVIGDTRLRTLGGRSDVTLQSLKVPVNISFYRRDRGFLLVSPQILSTAPNTLVLTLTETTDFATDRTALSIDPDGQVYLN